MLDLESIYPINTMVMNRYVLCIIAMYRVTRSPRPTSWAYAPIHGGTLSARHAVFREAD